MFFSTEKTDTDIRKKIGTKTNLKLKELYFIKVKDIKYIYFFN